MMYIAIALTMLSLVAGVHLLAKSKTNAMGKFSEWMAYAVIVLSIGMLLCELGRTGMGIIRHGDDGYMRGHHMGMMEYCPPEMCGGVACMMPVGHRGMRGNSGMDCCKEGMGSCKGGGKSSCHDDMDGDDGNESGKMMDGDSTKATK